MSFIKVCQLAEKFENIKEIAEKTPRPLRAGEGDNVDKAGDIVKNIEHHLQAIVPAVDDADLRNAEIHAKAIEGLAQALQFMIREMDPENG